MLVTSSCSRFIDGTDPSEPQFLGLVIVELLNSANQFDRNVLLLFLGGTNQLQPAIETLHQNFRVGEFDGLELDGATGHPTEVFCEEQLTNMIDCFPIVG